MARKPASKSTVKSNENPTNHVVVEPKNPRTNKMKMAYRRDFERRSTLVFRVDVLICETSELASLSSEACQLMSLGSKADMTSWDRWRSRTPEPLAEWWRCSNDLLEDVTECLDKHEAPESVRPKLHRIADIVRVVRSAVGGYELDPPRNRSRAWLHTGYCENRLKQTVHDLSDLRPLLPEDYMLGATCGDKTQGARGNSKTRKYKNNGKSYKENHNTVLRYLNSHQGLWPGLNAIHTQYGIPKSQIEKMKKEDPKIREAIETHEALAGKKKPSRSVQTRQFTPRESDDLQTTRATDDPFEEAARLEAIENYKKQQQEQDTDHIAPEIIPTH